MSDNPTTPVPADNGTPNTQQGQPASPATSPAATPPAAAAAPTEPYRAFANEAELTKFVQGAKGQAERSAIRKLAKDLGFEDADEMREALQSLRQAQGGAQSPNQPEAQASTGAPGTSPSNDGARLQLALQVGAKLNLPAALIGRLQGATEAEMEADAQTLLSLMGSGTARSPGIPPVPAGNTPVTFTRTQIQDAKFVREHAEEIQAAARDGRIVRS